MLPKIMIFRSDLGGDIIRDHICRGPVFHDDSNESANACHGTQQNSSFIERLICRGFE